jgi:hypothetical protein
MGRTWRTRRGKKEWVVDGVERKRAPRAAPPPPFFFLLSVLLKIAFRMYVCVCVEGGERMTREADARRACVCVCRNTQALSASHGKVQEEVEKNATRAPRASSSPRGSIRFSAAPMPPSTRSRSTAGVEGPEDGIDDPMLLSQATSRSCGDGSGGGGGGAAPGGRATDAAHHLPPCPPPPPPPPSITRRPSVRFAPGPLPHAGPDGHPPPTEARSGPPPRGVVASARRALWGEPNAAFAEEPLTPAHLRLLATELGPENEPSITRLKRR